MRKNAYYNDFNRSSFFVKEEDNVKKYYIKIKNEYIEVDEDVFKLYKNSYEKMKNDYKREVDWLNSINKEFNQSTFFVQEVEQTLVKQIVLKDMEKLTRLSIENLSKEYKEIARLIFLEEYTVSETSRILGIPRTTVSDRKKKIQKYLQKIIKKHVNF